MKKAIGLGSLSLVLALAALAWSCTFSGYCLGDKALTLMHLPSWSNGSSGIHYTVFYSFLFLLPAVILSFKYGHHFLSQVGRWLSLALAGILLISLFFMV